VAREALSALFDERAHAGPEHLDAAYVAAYDAKSPTDWSEEIDALRGLRTVVDLGAGTGAFALAVAPHVQRVVAVDVSSAMVAAMRARGLEAVEAGFLSYEHEGDPADAVHTRNALHHLPDFWKAIALVRIAQILRPGGTLLLRDIVYDFDPAEADAAIAAWIDATPADPARGWTGPELAEHVRDEHSTFTWLLEPMLERAGFELRERRVSSLVYASYVCSLAA
jgi:SAM-dependent methyltransferase